MAGGNGKKRVTPKQALDELKNINPQVAQKVASSVADGTLEDQVDTALLRTSEIVFRMNVLEQRVAALEAVLDVTRTQNFALMDIIHQYTGAGRRVFDIAFQNAVVYRSKDDSNMDAHIESRQASFRRRLEREGLI